MGRDAGNMSQKLVCSTARAYMPFLASGTLPPQEAEMLLLHLESCESCRSELSEVFALRRIIQLEVRGLPPRRPAPADLRSFALRTLVPEIVDAVAPPIVSRLWDIALATGSGIERRLRNVGA